MNDQANHPRLWQYSLRQALLITSLICIYLVVTTSLWWMNQPLTLLAPVGGAICSWAICGVRRALLGALIVGISVPIIAYLADPLHDYLMDSSFGHSYLNTPIESDGNSISVPTRLGTLVGFILVEYLDLILSFVLVGSTVGAIIGRLRAGRRGAMVGVVIGGLVGPSVRCLAGWIEDIDLILFFALVGSAVGAFIGRLCAGRRRAVVGVVIGGLVGPIVWYLAVSWMWSGIR